MGFIPIILFTLAFVFLWGIVNYNSLKKTRNEIARLQERTISISKERKTLATKLLSGLSMSEADKDNMATIIKIVENPLIEGRNIREALRNEASRSQLTAELDTLSRLNKTSLHPPALINALKELTMELKEIQPRIMDLFHNYDNMVSKPPSSFIARLFGF